MGASSSSGGQPNFSHDLSRPALTNLYNSPVYNVERVVRPLGSSSAGAGPFSHSGVRVTLPDNSQYLVHKGSGYGISSQMVVTDARHMSSAWQKNSSLHGGGRYMSSSHTLGKSLSISGLVMW
uniref:Uncharacterized protein n=1 Tax=Amphiprion ocellaris TaxID=80972 RepID=A0A3Q1BWP3_AMPOC